ncbi:hypothetical protein PR048_001482, partial [Dryococelus australis]
MTSDNILTSKKTHHYFYQVQGALNITSCQFCYFLIMTNRKKNISGQNILEGGNNQNVNDFICFACCQKLWNLFSQYDIRFKNL